MTDPIQEPLQQSDSGERVVEPRWFAIWRDLYPLLLQSSHPDDAEKLIAAMEHVAWDHAWPETANPAPTAERVTEVDLTDTPMGGLLDANAALRAEVERLEAKVERLTSRGIEDMKYEIGELRTRNAELVALAERMKWWLLQERDHGGLVADKGDLLDDILVALADHEPGGGE